MSDIKLSICITTFNRATLIGETLDSIISQLTNEVEIVIVDGGSTDNTEKIVQEYNKSVSLLHYFKQENNMGVDRDFNLAVELAQGDYCWLMSDDDILKPGAIRTVLNEIKSRRDYALIIVNSEVRTADLSRVVEKRMLVINDNQVYKPSEFEHFFSDVALYSSFIGCVVIKRRIWIQRERERYFGSLFIHVGVIFQSPMPGDTLVIAQPWIEIRYGHSFWTAKSFETWMFKWPQIIWSFPGYANSAKTKVYPQNPWRSIKLLLSYRAKGAYSLREYYDWIEPRIERDWRKVAAKIIAELPGYIINFMFFIYLSFFRQKVGTGIGLIDIKNSQYHFRNLLKVSNL